jgi:hypothetical protein
VAGAVFLLREARVFIQTSITLLSAPGRALKNETQPLTLDVLRREPGFA